MILWWMLLGAVGFVLLIWLAGCAVMLRQWWLRRRGPLGCPSVSTRSGSGRGARPDGLRCYRSPGHGGLHVGFDPAAGEAVHYWQQPAR